MFLGWTQYLASKLGIRRYVFSPSGSLGLSVINSMFRVLPDPANDNTPILFPDIPNSPMFPWWQLSPICRSYVEGNPAMEFARDAMCANLVSWGVVINSFTELDI